MIYPENFEQKVGFDTIRILLAEACVSDMGREYVSKIHFSVNPSVINKMLLQTTEFIRMIETGDTFPTHNYIDLRPELARLTTPGTYLSQEALFDLKSSLRTLQNILTFFKNTEAEEYPQLKILIADIAIPDALSGKADAIMDDKGEIRDTASTKLATIRQQMIVRQRQVMQEPKNRAGCRKMPKSLSVTDGRLSP